MAMCFVSRGCGVAMVWALLWILLMQCLAGFIVWLSILLFAGFFIAGEFGLFDMVWDLP